MGTLRCDSCQGLAVETLTCVITVWTEAQSCGGQCPAVAHRLSEGRFSLMVCAPAARICQPSAPSRDAAHLGPLLLLSGWASPVCPAARSQPQVPKRLTTDAWEWEQ